MSNFVNRWTKTVRDDEHLESSTNLLCYFLSTYANFDARPGWARLQIGMSVKSRDTIKDHEAKALASGSVQIIEQGFSATRGKRGRVTTYALTFPTTVPGSGPIQSAGRAFQRVGHISQVPPLTLQRSISRIWTSVAIHRHTLRLGIECSQRATRPKPRQLDEHVRARGPEHRSVSVMRNRERVRSRPLH